MDRVLALSMRPKTLEDCVGQSEFKSNLTTQLNTGRIPHFFIVHGPVGAGKTTIARILALYLQLKRDVVETDWNDFKQYDIQEINAANKNGIDDIRTIVENMRYKPMPTSAAKIVILDEAHQLTIPAQNALLTETEDVANHVFYIFCTSVLNKIIPALQRRAYIISPRPLDKDDIKVLLQKAAEYVQYNDEVEPLHEALTMNFVTSPGLILQAAEKFFSGFPAIESVHNCETSKLDTMAICRAVTAGSWKDTAILVKSINKNDVTMIRSCLLGYLNKVLLGSVGTKAVSAAKAIRNLVDDTGNECLPGFIASICIACEHMKSNKANT